VAAEAFADRTYQADGTLTPRGRVDALLGDEAAVKAQVLRLIRESRVRATDGTDVELAVDTLCLHGDGTEAVSFARGVRAALDAAGVRVRPLS
jgi:UPF0271 protein